MMALAGVEPETLVSEPDALTTRPPPFGHYRFIDQPQLSYNTFEQC